jgi:serine protease Do
MKKYQILVVILIASVTALAVQILFGNFLSAQLSTMPLLRNLDLFNPRAPIVVTNRETVRVSDSNDAIETTNAAKSKLSSVVYYEGEGDNAHLVVSGGAINWTADGYFLTSKQALGVANKTYAVVLNNGDIFPVKDVFPDVSSSMVLLSTDARSLATIEPANLSELRPGQKILMIQNSLAANKNTFLESYMRSFITDVSGVGFSSDQVGRFVSIQGVGPLSPGHAALNLDGRLVGMWDGTQVISSDAIRLFANNFFRDNLKVIRPSYGFTYMQLSAAEARALQLVAGAKITVLPPETAAIKPGSPAANAKLQVGDIITSVNGQKVDDEHLLEDLLATQTPGEVVTFAITRDGQSITVLITPTILE